MNYDAHVVATDAVRSPYWREIARQESDRHADMHLANLMVSSWHNCCCPACQNKQRARGLRVVHPFISYIPSK